MSTHATFMQLNRHVMSVIFFLPLWCIALYETTFHSTQNNWMKTWYINRDQSDSSMDPEGAASENPEVDGEDASNGLEISRVKFAELIKAFPNTHQSSEATIVKEIVELRGLVEKLVKQVGAK